VAACDLSIPASPQLESAVFPDVADIITAAKAMI
jgi:hypothetical protein